MSIQFSFAASSSGGLTLIEGAGARASALGDAFTTMTDDVSAFGYNPAALQSLSNGHASFSYEKGLVDDYFGQLMLGSPTRFGGLGVSVAFYDGGEIDISNGVESNTVKAQRDLMVGLGMSREIGKTAFGITGKYLSSELIEQERAQAFAADFGLSRPLGSHLRWGAAVQNFGTQLKFVDEGDDLPRIARTGLSLSLAPRGVPTTLLLDAPYHLNEQEWQPAVGIEVSFGILAMRAGYKSGNDLEGFSVGTGFMVGRSSLDYSFGLVDELNSQHRVSLAMRFGNGTPGSRDFVKKKKRSPRKVQRTVVELPVEKESPIAQNKKYNLGNVDRKGINRMKTRRRVYTIKNGDSLTKISKKFYGMYGMWKTIYRANQHLIDDPRDVEVGQKIVIP